MGKKLMQIVLASSLLGSTLGINKTYAAPVMNISSSSQIADWDSNSLNGLEQKISYDVNNTTPGGDVDDDAMRKLIIPAGTNQGVYSAIAPENWSSQINLDNTIFNVINSPGYLSPGNSNIFEIFSTSQYLANQTGLASADSRFNGSFNNENVLVPSAVPEPSYLELGIVGALGAFRIKKRRI